MPSHELGHGMNHHVGAVFNWPQQDWCRDRVVYDQRHAMLVRHSRQTLAIEFKRNRLIDRHSHGLRCGITVVANVNGDGLSLHAYTNSKREGFMCSKTATPALLPPLEPLLFLMSQR